MVHKPKALDVIQEAIELIVSGEIIDYHYDEIDEVIIGKERIK